MPGGSANRPSTEYLTCGLLCFGFARAVCTRCPQRFVVAARLGRSYLRLAEAELARLLLGQCDPAEAVAAGRMEPSTQMALRLAGQLFPRQPLWCPMWDDLPA